MLGNTTINAGKRNKLGMIKIRAPHIHPTDDVIIENAGPEKEDQKWERVETEGAVAHIIKQNTRVPDAQKLQIIQLVEKNNAKALEVSMNISRKRVSS